MIPIFGRVAVGHQKLTLSCSCFSFLPLPNCLLKLSHPLCILFYFFFLWMTKGSYSSCYCPGALQILSFRSVIGGEYLGLLPKSSLNLCISEHEKKRTIRECHFLFFSGADGGHQRDAQSRDSAHFLHSSFLASMTWVDHVPHRRCLRCLRHQLNSPLKRPVLYDKMTLLR